MNLLSVRQIRENELTDFVNSLLSSGLNTVSGISGTQGISGIYANYNAGYVTIGFTGAQVTGSNPLGNFNFSGIGGAEVILSGNNILISGGAGGSSNTGELTGVFYPLLSNPSGYLTNNSGSVGGDLTDYNKFAQFNQYGQLDYRTTILPDLNHDIDKRIWGLTATTGNKRIFSSINHTTATYVRNTGCWAYGIDLTPISVWNSQGGNQRGGILISPRHVLMAAHFPITGTLRWVTNDNQVVSGSTSGHASINGTDLRIAVLSGDVTGVSYAKVFSNEFTGYFNTSGIPVLFTDQEENALVGETFTSFNSNINIDQGSNVYRSGFYESPVGGDSGDPICSIIGNELVTLSTFFTSNSGPSISYYYTGANSAINSLGNSNGYQLTPVSQNYFPISYYSLADTPNPQEIDNFYITGSGGVLDINNIVFTTGNQTISGDKIFGDSVEITSISGGNRFFVSLGVGVSDYLILANQFGFKLKSLDNQESIDVNGRLLRRVTASTGISLDYSRLILSGNWLTNTTPTQSGHIVNKGYLDSQTNSFELITMSGSPVINANSTSRNHSIILNINSGNNGNYSGSLVLPTGNRIIGDKIQIHCNYEASTRPDVQIYSASSGVNNLLFSWSGDGTATKINTEYVYTGLGYYLMNANFLG